MAAVFKGLFLQLGVDGQALLKDFEKVDVQLRKTQSELNTLQRSLKIEFDNDKFIKAQELAQRALQESKEKVEVLRKAIAEADKQGVGKSREEYKELVKELNKAELVAQKANKQLEEINNIKLNKIKKEFEELHSKVDKMGDDLIKAGSGVMAGVAGAAAGLGYAAKAAIDYEQAFVGVAKTVKATDEQLEQLNADLLEMSTTIPVSAEDLAGIAASAGQLGIKAENILGFTRTIADLGVASNLSGEEGATMLAKFANITQMPQTDFDRLGSAIVALGNNSSTTESDIAAMAMRLAGAGNQAGMSEADILGFAAALSSVGIEAESGGSAFSKVFNQMNLAVQTGSEKLSQFATVAGMTSAEFQKAFSENAAGAVTEFIKGLSEAGEGALLILDDMEISEVRMMDALSRTAGAGDLLADSINLSTQAWNDNKALTDEASTAYESTANQIQLLKNEINKMAIEIGNMLLPYIRDGINTVKDFVQWIADWDDGTKKLIMQLVALGGTLGATLIAVGLLTKGLGAAIGVIGTLKVAIVTYEVAVLSGATATKAFSAALMSNPAGLVAIGITALVVAIGSFITVGNQAATETDKLREKADELIESTADLRLEYEDFKKTIDEKNSSTIAEIEVAKKLIPELEALTNKTERTKEENIRLESIISQLNRVMPELKLAIDDETDALNRQIGVVYAAADAYIALARAKAYESVVIKTQTELIETKYERDKLIEKEGKAAESFLEISARTRKEHPNDPVLEGIYDLSEERFKESQRQIAELDKTIAAGEEKTKKLTEEALKLREENQGVIDGLKSDTSGGGGGGGGGGGSSGGSSSSSEREAERAAEQAAKEAEERRKAAVKAYEDNISKTESDDIWWNQIEKDMDRLTPNDELFNIGERARRYREYTAELAMSDEERNNILAASLAEIDAMEGLSEEERLERYMETNRSLLTVAVMTEDEKASLHEQYKKKAVETERDYYKFEKDLREQAIKVVEDEYENARQLQMEYLNDRKNKLAEVLAEETEAIQAAKDAELNSISERIAAQKELLQVKIDAINEEIKKRRELREDENAEERLDKIRKQIAATQALISSSRDEDTKRELEKELIRQQEELSKALQEQEDTAWYRQKDLEIKAIESQMDDLSDREKELISQANMAAQKAVARATRDMAVQKQEAERSAMNSAMSLYNTYYDTSNVTTTYNNQQGTVIIQQSTPNSAIIARAMNEIMKG